MKILTATGLTKLIQLIKSSFIKVDDTVETDTLDIDTTVTSGSGNLITSGAVYSFHDSTKYDASNPSGYQNASQVSSAISSATSSFITKDVNNLTNYTTTTALNTLLAGKQPVGDYATNTALTNGLATKQNIITASNKLSYSLLSDTPTIPTVPTNVSAFTNDAGYITSSYHDSTKQNTLVSGTNIKTINSTSLLGSGNVAVQPTLVSGTNIKTVNNQSLLGSGNITIEAGSSALEDLTDVELTSLTDNQALLYDATTDKWENKNIGAVVENTTLKFTGAYNASQVANKDLSNLTNTGKSTIFELNTASIQYITLTLGASNSTYTAPANGYFYLNKNSAGSSGGGQGFKFAKTDDNGQQFGNKFIATTNSQPVEGCSMLVKKGEVIKVWYSLGGNTNYFRFYYAEGSI